MARIVLPSLLIFCLLGLAWSTFEDEFEEKQRRMAAAILHRYETDPQYAQLFDQWVHDQNEVSNDTFPCKPLKPSTKVPKSVHKLRPGDINVIAAVGDSLTAGRSAANGIFGLLTDFPELSWSIGGKDDYQKHKTLPNILREYNPDLYGYSPSRNDFKLNKAKSGARADYLVNETRILVDAMKEDPKVDFEKDWKLITVFIGGNDLCDSCQDFDKFSPDNYIAKVAAALDVLHEEVPRVFVNLVEVINVEMLQDLNKGVVCTAAHLYACACASHPPSEEAEEKLVSTRKGYQQKCRELVASGRYDTRNDFTVVVQPFYQNTFPPFLEDGNVDYSYFAADCFHESAKGHEAAAKALWNNMVQPVGSKSLEWYVNEPMMCPTNAHPYLYTNKNSG